MRAGVAGGVLGTLAMTAGSASASASVSATGEEAADTAATTTQLPVLTGELAVANKRTAASLQTSAAQYELQAAKEAAAAKAAEHAAEQKKEAEAEARRKAAAERRAEAAQAAEERASRSSARAELNVSASGSVGELVSFLRAQVGKPYVMGASGPSSYDCSGLVQTAFQQIGVSLPRVSQDQSAAGTPVSTSALQPGDILYWGGAGSAYHVAVYVGGGQYVDAANPEKGVVLQSLSDWPPDGATRVL